MPTITIELERLHTTQEKIVSEASLRNVWISGRQSGKTILAHHLIVTGMLAAKSCALFAPTYKTASESWRGLKDKLHAVTSDTNEQERRLQIHGDGSLEVWSLDDSNAGRGRQYDLVIIDEAGQVRDLEAAWASVQPMLAIRGGAAWIISTPTGAGTYLHGLFEKGRGLFRGHWRSWQTTSGCNPFLPASAIETAKADLSERAYQQEYESAWISWEGGVFTRIREALLDGAPQGKAGIIGVDWAGSSGGGDFTSFCVLSDCGHILELVRLRGEPFVQQRAKLRGLWERHGRPPILAEQNGMGVVVNSDLRADGVPVLDWTTSNASKTQIVSALVQGFETGAIRIPNDEFLLGELGSFQCTPLAGGQFRYSAPPGLHDDYVMALAIAFAGLGNAVKRRTDAVMIGSLLAGNSDLIFAGGSPWHVAGSEADRLPHEYPMGGTGGRGRWSM